MMTIKGKIENSKSPKMFCWVLFSRVVLRLLSFTIWSNRFSKLLKSPNSKRYWGTSPALAPCIKVFPVGFTSLCSSFLRASGVRYTLASLWFKMMILDTSPLLRYSSNLDCGISLGCDQKLAPE